MTSSMLLQMSKLLLSSDLTRKIHTLGSVHPAYIFIKWNQCNRPHPNFFLKSWTTKGFAFVMLYSSVQRGAFSQVFLNDFLRQMFRKWLQFKNWKIGRRSYLFFLLLTLKYASSPNLVTSISKTRKGKDPNKNSCFEAYFLLLCNMH